MGKILLPSGRGRSGEDVTEDFNEIEDYDDDDTRKAKLEQWMAKKVGTALVKAYNNRQWKVVIDLEGKMMIIACDSISNYKGYHISMVGRTVHDLEIEGVKAAGEILERHNIARSKRFDADIIETLARDAQDNVIAVDSAAEPI
jgi:hypothetical protein